MIKILSVFVVLSIFKNSKLNYYLGLQFIYEKMKLL